MATNNTVKVSKATYDDLKAALKRAGISSATAEHDKMLAVEVKGILLFVKDEEADKPDPRCRRCGCPVRYGRILCDKCRDEVDYSD